MKSFTTRTSHESHTLAYCKDKVKTMHLFEHKLSSSRIDYAETSHTNTIYTAAIFGSVSRPVRMFKYVAEY